MREHTLLLLLRKQLIVCREVLTSLNKNYFTASIIFPYFNAPPLDNMKVINKIIACSETPFGKKLYRIETIQLICNANRLTGSYMTQVFRERCFCTDYS